MLKIRLALKLRSTTLMQGHNTKRSNHLSCFVNQALLCKCHITSFLVITLKYYIHVYNTAMKRFNNAELKFDQTRLFYKYLHVHTGITEYNSNSFTSSTSCTEKQTFRLLAACKWLSGLLHKEWYYDSTIKYRKLNYKQ